MVDGTLHGFGLAWFRLWQKLTGNQEISGFRRYLNIFLTFHFVTFTWIFFRAPNLETVRLILSRIGSLTIAFANVSLPLALVLAVAMMAHYLPKKWYEFSLGMFARAPFYAQAAALALLAIGLQYVAQTGAAPFIYTKF